MTDVATTDRSVEADTGGAPTGRLRAARTGALVVAILAFLALAALALSADEGDAVLREGAAGPRKVTNVVPLPAVTPPATVLPAAPAPAAARPRGVEAVTPAPTPVAAPAPVEEPAAEPPAALCSLGLPAPERTGGLASMISLVPAFGSFSAEAFAMAPAYEPVIDLFGPFLPGFAEMLAANEAAVSPIVAALRQLSDAGYDTLAPLYGPYRPDVLDGLKDLAAALAPYSEQLATSEFGVCLIALEGVLAGAAG